MSDCHGITAMNDNRYQLPVLEVRGQTLFDNACFRVTVQMLTSGVFLLCYL